jgi:hypothetical protein
MKSKQVRLSIGKTIEIKNLPLGRYAELLKALKKLPKNVRDIQDANASTVIEQLPILIGNSWSDFMDIFAIASPLSKEEIENEIDLNDAVDVTLAIIEVNNYKEIYEKVKKALAQPAQITEGQGPTKI